MTSPIKTIKLPISGAEVQVKEWITGAEAEAIEAILYEAIDAQPSASGRVNFGKINPEIIDKQAHKELEIFVVSVGGSTEEVLPALLSLPEIDYKFIRDTVKELRNPKKKDEPEVGGQAQ
jgi:hypothetical protein